MRLDVWLDVACLFRTRSEAQKACKGGKVDVNGQATKAHREIREGDSIEISRPFGRKQTVIVRVLAELERWARDQGCRAIRIYGRRGWRRVLRDYRPFRDGLQKELS